MSLKKGILIAVEGIDGSGKSTLAKSLAQALERHHLPVLLTKEPGGTALGLTLRALVQEKNAPTCFKSEYLLFAADRAQHMEEVVQPSLEKKMIVISDRMADSSLIYQGYGRGLDLDMLRSINRWVMNNIKPDLTLYLKIDVQTAMQRIAQRNHQLTSFEQEKTAFFQRLVRGFDNLYDQRTDVISFDAHQSIEQLTNQATEQIFSWLKQQHLIS